MQLLQPSSWVSMACAYEARTRAASSIKLQLALEGHATVPVIQVDCVKKLVQLQRGSAAADCNLPDLQGSKLILVHMVVCHGLAGIYFGFIAPDNGPNQSWAVPAVIAVLVVASVALLLVTALMDPGFVPRNTNPKDAELGYVAHAPPLHLVA